VQAVTQGHHGFKILLSSWRERASDPPQPTPTPGNQTGGGSQNSEPVVRTKELGVDKLVYFEPTNDMWNDAWRVTEGLISEMANEVRARGAKFVVVTLSNGAQVLPNPAAREQFKKRIGITDLFYPDNRIKSLGAREGIPVVMLAPELQQFAERNNVFLHGFGQNIGNGHWNPTGHRVAGELIAKKICEEALLK
jgi:hypothetical protein